MKTIQIAVVDDLPRDRDWLAKTLADYMAREQLDYVLSAFSCGEEFLSALETRQFDIVFMDVYMGGMTGVEAASVLRTRDRNCRLVFLTTSEDYMRQGFSLNSAHYLVKPVKDEDFRQAMENCCIRQQIKVPLLSIPAGRQTIQIDTLKLCYADMENRTAIFHTVNGNLKAGRNFSAVIAPLLSDRRFLLCHKALLVNMDHIAALEEDSFRMTDGTLLPIAPRRRQDILSRYRNYVFGNMGGA